MNLTPAQIIALVISTLGVLAGASAQLTTLFGQNVAGLIVTSSSLLSAVLAGWIAVLTGQASITKQVAAMPGVERVVVNENANPVLASVATDPAQPKVGATDSDTQEKLQRTAHGA